MKKILLFLLALTPLAAFAQLSGSGYYRVQNDVTKRYISIVDTRAEVTTNGIDLRALHMLKPFEDSGAYNPASICYVDLVSSSQCNLTGQGLNLHDQVGRYLNYIERSGGCYWLYGQINNSGMKILVLSILFITPMMTELIEIGGYILLLKRNRSILV